MSSLDERAVPTATSVSIAKPVGPICNLHCDYCYYLDTVDLFARDERFRMSEQVLERYVAGAIAGAIASPVHFVWHGGEPLLAGRAFYESAFELQRRYLPAGWTCLNSMQTNGTLLDDRWASFIAEHHVAVGLSIDGHPAAHDRLRRDRRGRETHARVLAALARLRTHGVEPDILCTVNAVSAADPLTLYRYLRDLGVSWIQFIPVVARDHDGVVTAQSVTPEAFGAFLCAVFDEWVRHDVNRLVVQGFLEGLFVTTSGHGTLCVSAETCGQVLAIEHDGSVYSCDHFVDRAHRLGSLRTDSLSQLANSTRQQDFAAAKRDALPTECRDCTVLAFCRGGCPKDRFTSTAAGEPGLNYLCAGYRRFFEHARTHLERMGELVARRQRPSLIMAELADAEASRERSFQLARRNDPCPCGSGRKFKNCCLMLRGHVAPAPRRDDRVASQRDVNTPASTPTVGDAGGEAKPAPTP